MLDSVYDILVELKSIAKVPVTFRILPRVSVQVMPATFLKPEAVKSRGELSGWHGFACLSKESVTGGYLYQPVRYTDFSISNEIV